MAQRWQENTASGPRVIGGRLLQPGEGIWVDDGPIAGDLSPRMTSATFASLAAAGRLIDGQLYAVDGLLRIAISPFEWEFVSAGHVQTAAPSYASQFGALNRRSLPIRSVIVSASGSIKLGACAVAGYRCVTPGSSGTFAINDDFDAATAAQIRETRAYTAATANTYYPMALDDQAAMLMGIGCYVTVPTGGVYVVDLIDDISALTGIEGQGMLLEPVRVAATGLALWDAPAIASVKVIAPGSAGTLTIHDATAASDATRLRLSIAYGSLTAGQIIPLGGKGAAPTFGCAYVTITTSGIFLLNRYPG